MRLAPGSLVWLVLWDLRVRWRSLGYTRIGLSSIAIYAAFFLLLHGAAAAIILEPTNKFHTQAQALAVLAQWCLWGTLMMAMFGAVGLVRLLMAGPELALLLSSPLPLARVLWSRVLVFMVLVWSVNLMLAVPAADAGALLGHPRFLLAYPVSLALAALVAAGWLALAALLVRGLGVVRARQALWWLVGAMPVAWMVLVFVNAGAGNAGSDGTHSWTARAAGVLMAWPARALTGDAGALAACLAVAALALWVVQRYAAAPFHASLLTPDAPRARQARSARPMRWRSSLSLLFLSKEWRTILREPRLAVALFQQPLIALMFLYLSLQLSSLAAGAAAAIAETAGLLASYLGSLTISAEEAPGLLAAVPVPRARLIRLKCVAVLAPVIAAVAAAALAVALADPWAGLVALACGCGAAFSATAVEVAAPYPFSRRSFTRVAHGRRHRSPLDLLSISVMILGWAAGAWFLAGHHWWGAGIVFLVILVPFWQWWRDINREAILGY
ncbi:MAG: hypothetical protein KGJ55_08985 [Gammaproteobacteria bacterium]|nr:hypothetical protein [Gammaproteobacteria bacterium]